MAIIKKKLKKGITFFKRVVNLFLSIVGWKMVMVGIFKVIMMEFTKFIVTV